MIDSESSFQQFRTATFYEYVVSSERKEYELSAQLKYFSEVEYREICSIAALGSAFGLLPRELVAVILERYKPVTEVDTGPNFSLVELPTKEEMLSILDHEVRLEEEFDSPPDPIDHYLALRRRIDRTPDLKQFMAEILFSNDQMWESHLSELESGFRSSGLWEPEYSELFWLADGADAYLDFAESCGHSPIANVRGTFLELRYQHFRGKKDAAFDHFIELAEIGGLSPFFMSWRYGGWLQRSTVNARLSQVLDLIVRYVPNLDAIEDGESRRSLEVSIREDGVISQELLERDSD